MLTDLHPFYGARDRHFVFRGKYESVFSFERNQNCNLDSSMLLDLPVITDGQFSSLSRLYGDIDDDL
jgi:hypothetical protein